MKTPSDFKTLAFALATAVLVVLPVEASSAWAGWSCAQFKSPYHERCMMLQKSCRTSGNGILTYQLTSLTLKYTSSKKACYQVPVMPIGPLISNLKLHAPDHVMFQTTGGWPGVPGRWVSVQLHDIEITSRFSIVELADQAAKELMNSTLIPRGERTYVSDGGAVMEIPEFEALANPPNWKPPPDTPRWRPIN
jgi:hypothetical protein